MTRFNMSAGDVGVAPETLNDELRSPSGMAQKLRPISRYRSPTSNHLSSGRRCPSESPPRLSRRLHHQAMALFAGQTRCRSRCPQLDKRVKGNERSTVICRPNTTPIPQILPKSFVLPALHCGTPKNQTLNSISSQQRNESKVSDWHANCSRNMPNSGSHRHCACQLQDSMLCFMAADPIND